MWPWTRVEQRASEDANSNGQCIDALANRPASKEHAAGVHGCSRRSNIKSLEGRECVQLSERKALLDVLHNGSIVRTRSRKCPSQILV